VTESKIATLEDLHAYLYAALQLEHATIPPYMTALYSLHNGSNSAAWHIIRVVVVEEMLHLALAANVLNAVGGSPDLTAPDFVPAYPAYLPSGEQDFEVSIQSFSAEAVETFLNIERPAKAPTPDRRLVPRHQRAGRLLAASPTDPGMQYYSIGEFYAEITRGLQHLNEEYERQGKKLFTGDRRRQVTPEFFYSGGGEPIVVTGLESALRAVDFIAEQGEGFGGSIYDSEDELAHYYRFKQLKHGHYYQKGDHTDDPPSGPALWVDWSTVYPVLKNARLDDYPAGSELRKAARDFNATYAGFLRFLTKAFTGEPELLLEAVPEMFRLRDEMSRLIRNPIPGRPGVHAAPTFEPADAMGSEA
jgi:Ferritin-like